MSLIITPSKCFGYNAISVALKCVFPLAQAPAGAPSGAAAAPSGAAQTPAAGPAPEPAAAAPPQNPVATTNATTNQSSPTNQTGAASLTGPVGASGSTTLNQGQPLRALRKCSHRSSFVALFRNGVQEKLHACPHQGCVHDAHVPSGF